jgi:Bacterial Ig-like domain (group 3)
MRVKSLLRGLSALLVTLVGGVAVAQHSTASYTQVVSPAAGTITLTSSQNPSGVGQAVTFIAALPSGATGTVQFFDGSNPINTAVTVASGSAATTTSTLTLGAHSITAAFTANTTTAPISNYASVTSAIFTQNVGQGSSNLALTSAPNPSTYGQGVTFTATLASTATGNINFYDTSTNTSLGIVPASSGTAVLNNITTLAVGTHNVQAQYAGDANFLAGNSAKDPQVVNKATTATTVLTSSLNPATYGVSITFTATLPANATGTVTFLDNGVSIGTGTLTGGIATFSISNLAFGPHPITATYPGDANYAAAPTSNTVTEQINQKTGETITLTSSANPANFGAPVTFTATVPTDATGTIQFYDGATKLGSPVAVVAGVATYTTSSLSVSPPAHAITAVYSGDTNYGNVTSTAVSQVINIVSAMMTISGAPNPSVYGGSVVMTITVTGVNGVIPTGTVTLMDGSTPLGSTLTLDATGKATYTTSALTAGSHSITATYSGDSNYK